MNRVLLIGCGAVIAFVVGFFSVSAADSGAGRSNDSWIDSQSMVSERRPEALVVLEEAGRWQIELETQSDQNKSGRFDSDYRVIALVDTGNAYALLQKTNGSEIQAATMIKVFVGDRLDDGWRISQIEDAAVTAEREDESQRVELFPQT